MPRCPDAQKPRCPDDQTYINPGPPCTELNEQECFNQEFAQLIKMKNSYKDDDHVIEVSLPIPLPKKISKNNTKNPTKYNYYRYQGSLTTPNCNEVVIWSIFEEVILIDFGQMKKVENFRDNLKRNNRDLQGLNFRNVSSFSYEVSGGKKITFSWFMIVIFAGILTGK